MARLFHDAATLRDEEVPYPYSWAGWVAGIWMVVGLAYLIYLYNRDAQRVADTGKVFLEEGAPETVGAV